MFANKGNKPQLYKEVVLYLNYSKMMNYWSDHYGYVRMYVKVPRCPT